jgi:membrane-bound lytic murein transglycosylase C
MRNKNLLIIAVLSIAFSFNKVVKEVEKEGEVSIVYDEVTVVSEKEVENDIFESIKFSDLSKLKVPYINVINKYSEKYSFQPSFIAGIVKQESRFKSNVVSNRNAIGLMQVVPDKAGHDMNRIIFKVDAPIADSLLFDPSFNVRIGCAYLNYLRENYFRNINSNMSKRYCLIAAYNTGAANVVKAFVTEEEMESIEGYSKLSKYKKFLAKVDFTVEKINKMNHIEVKKTMIDNLPYPETVVYLNRIIDYVEEWNVETVAMNL